MKLEKTVSKKSKETGTVELLMDSINISRSIASTVVDKRENLCFIGESYNMTHMRRIFFEADQHLVLVRIRMARRTSGRRFLITHLLKESKVMGRRFYSLSKRKLRLGSEDVR